MRKCAQALGTTMMISLLAAALLVAGAVAGEPLPLPDPGRTATTSPEHFPDDGVRPRRPSGRLPGPLDPFVLISRDSLLGYLQELTAFGAYSGWRYSTTSGEAAARAWVTEQLQGMSFLQQIGLEIEEQPFHTYLGIEMWQTRLVLTVDGVASEVAADGQPGERENLALALRFDSDGRLNDSNRDPLVVQGTPLPVRTVEELYALESRDVADRIVFLDYAVVDRSIMRRNEAVGRASHLVALNPAGIVLVTRFSNTQGASHGSFAGDLSAFVWVDEQANPPLLNLRLEDLAGLGITAWSHLERIEAAELTLDVDLYSPGDSAYLEARIPGRDSSQAVILGAHLDSPNTPGALDDGSGSVTLLEVARVLDGSWTQPPVDLHLVWFGSHERGLYGSTNFVATHSDLLDRTIAMLQTDCLTSPLDGYNADLWLETWPYTLQGDEQLPWPEYLSGQAAASGTTTRTIGLDTLVSDSSSFAGSDVPHANLISLDLYNMSEVHYDGHLHDPYDTIELATREAATLEAMARVALTAALDTGRDRPQLRVTPVPDRRALLVASHTEAAHMTQTALIDFGMTLAWEGFDVDSVPYGQAVTAADLEGADLVIALPVHDYPSPDGDPELYDEAWSPQEVELLTDYVAGGGLLVLTNSAHRLKWYNVDYEENEDWPDAGLLGTPFGVVFTGGEVSAGFAATRGDHPLVDSLSGLYLVAGNALAFTHTGGTTLAATTADQVVAAVLGHGDGEVVVLGDLGILGSTGGARNLAFWQNLASFARTR